MSFQFNHPHEIHKVFDNTEFQSLPESVTGTIAFVPFISDKGRDGVTLHTNLATFIKEYGQPNFRRHGQAIYNAIAHLNAGGILYACRIAAPEATYANLLVKVAIKTEEPVAPEAVKAFSNTVEKNEKEGKATEVVAKAKTFAVTKAVTKPTATIKIITEQVIGLSSPDEVEAELKKDPVVDGEFTVYPLFIITANGRGKASNGSVFRLSKSKEDTNNDNKVQYFIELMYQDNGRGVYDGGEALLTYVDPEYIKSNGTSFYMENISKKYLTMHNINVNEESYFAIMDTLEPIAEANGADINLIDFLLKDTTSQPDYIVFDPTSVTLNSPTGLTLGAGVDGNWTGALNYDTFTGLSEALTSAFSGELDPRLLDKNQLPVKVIFDANYPIEVKNAAAALVLSEEVREDIHAYMDLGIVKTVTAAKEVRDALTWDNCNVSIQGWICKTFDPYTQKEITVTGPWTIAAKLANHDRNFGYHRPMAGYDTGILNGVVSDSLAPLPATKVDKDALYNSKINYVEMIQGNYIIASQITTQAKKSDLQLINNVRIKGEIIRAIMSLVPQFKHNFSNPDTLKTFKDLCELKIEDISKICAEPIKITLSQSEYQKANRILQIALDVMFESVIERIYVPININPNTGSVEV